MLTGGLGKDTMSGGLGNDTFDYNALKESAVGTKSDLILDFKPGADKIDLSTIDADSVAAGNNAFTFLEGAGTAFASTPGQVHFFFSGATTVVEMDVTGDGVADMQITLKGNVGLTGSTSSCNAPIVTPAPLTRREGAGAFSMMFSICC